MHSSLGHLSLKNKTALMINWAWDTSSELITLKLATFGEGVYCEWPKHPKNHRNTTDDVSQNFILTLTPAFI